MTPLVGPARRARAGRALLRRADAAPALPGRARGSRRCGSATARASPGAARCSTSPGTSAPCATSKRYIDLIALYKLNRLHLHLSDDQGWRIAIAKWPRLATHGGQTAVGGGKGGYYTQAQYADIVRYARRAVRRRSCPRSTCPGTSTPRSPRTRSSPATGSRRRSTPGSTSASARSASPKAVTYDFVSDVVGELARLTPGPWFHIGGDEAMATKPADYVTLHRSGCRRSSSRTASTWSAGRRSARAKLDRGDDRRSTGTSTRREAARCRRRRRSRERR